LNRRMAYSPTDQYLRAPFPGARPRSKSDPASTSPAPGTGPHLGRNLVVCIDGTSNQFGLRVNGFPSIDECPTTKKCAILLEY
jgi:hypothetical protein